MSRTRSGRACYAVFSAAIVGLGLLSGLAVAAPAAAGTAAATRAGPHPGSAAHARGAAVIRTVPRGGAVRPATRLASAPDLGPDVYIFTPSMPQSQIQATVDAIAAQQVPNQFGTQRYALLFEPGTYGAAADPLTFQVGYYTEVAGLGAAPGDVVINGTIDVYNQCFPTTDGSSNCIALDNFWRSLSNLTINVAGRDRLPDRHRLLGGVAGRADAPGGGHRRQPVADGLLLGRRSSPAAGSSPTPRSPAGP